MSHTIITYTTALSSHRAGEGPERYARRLSRARLKKPEQAEIANLYELLDAERAPWSPVDILEWRDLNPRERYLDLKGYALASDRIARAMQQDSDPQTLRLAA